MPLGVLLVAALVLGGPAGARALVQLAADGPSPAQGHAAVIAQGVSAMPASEVAWRMVRDRAEPNEEAEPRERALGFVYADEAAVVVNDLTDGSQTRVAPGEASFIAEGNVQHRASLGDDAVAYLRIALVPAEQAGDDGGDRMVYAGDAFAAPDGNRDIDLVRGVLAEDETSTIADAGFPTLVYAAEGELEVEADGQTTALAAGEAGTFAGQLTVTGTGAGESSFVAAVIGPDVPEPPRFSGTITLAVYACASGVEAAAVAGPDLAGREACEALADAPEAGLEIALQTADDEELSLAEAVPGTRGATGTYVWRGLPFGDYTLGEPAALPAGFGDYVLLGADGAAMETGEIAISRADPDARVDLYLIASAAGSVTVRVYNCPEGMTPETMVGDDCELATEGFQVVLAPGEGEGPSLGLDDAEADGAAHTWSGLPVGDEEPALYRVTETELPEGYADFVIVGGEVGTPNDPYVVGLTVEEPSAELAIYNFVAAPEATGSITMTAYLCPAPGATADECIAGGTLPLQGALLVGPDGADAQQYTLTDATTEGDTVTWGGLPLGVYQLITVDGNLALPEGYTIDRVEGTLGGFDAGYVVELTGEDEDAEVLVLAVASAAEPTDEDEDGDGLSDAEEETRGTDPAVADTDVDGLGDGAEVEGGTDPLNPDTDGDCSIDGVEVDSGTDPLDPTSTAGCA